MEAINDSSKAVAKVLSLLLQFDNRYPNHPEIEESIKILENALEKLVDQM